jgi:hypothetical protein
MKKVLSFVLIIVLFSVSVNAQIRQVPLAVKDSFGKQYPNAVDIGYKDMLTGVQVHFVLNGVKMIAKYNNKGTWKETEKESNYDKMTPAVQDGFNKSKYADWKVTETAVIYLPDGTERYRLKVEKNDVQKKYLYFDRNGRLVRDAITV